MTHGIIHGREGKACAPGVVSMGRPLIFALLAAFVLPGCGSVFAGDGRASARTESSEPRAGLYDCEGCKEALKRDPTTLSFQAQIASNEPGEKFIIRGRVFATDGITPAPNIVVYAHHTNAAGYYVGGSDESEWTRRHGKLRGWVRTGRDGRYEFQSIKPGFYPRRTEPAHVHMAVWEPGRHPYWIDDLVFGGEFGVTDKYRSSPERGAGGLGIVRLERSPDGTWLATRNIVLERHPL